MKKKTVLLFNTIYPTRTGGMEVYNYRLSKNLLIEKYPEIIMLLTSSVDKDNRRTFHVNKRLFGTTRWGLGMLSILISCIFSSRIRVREWKVVLIPYTSNFEYSAWPIVLFSKLFGFKYVLHCHGGSVRPWKTPKLQCLMFRNALHITAVSEKIINEYSVRTGCKIEYLPPLIDFKMSCKPKYEVFDSYAIPHYDIIILYVGSLKPLKSPETLLKAFSDLPETFIKEKNVGLVIAGEGELLQDLKCRYGTIQNITFLGAVKNEHIADLYLISNIYVICSWYEGTPISLVEAMFNGLCCIGTRVQGIDAIINNNVNGLLFEKDSSSELNQLLQKCISGQINTNKLGENAHKFYMDNFSYKNHIHQVLNLLEY